MSSRRIEILVGLFVLLGMAALLFLALQAANLASFNTEPTYALTARFDNIGGLKVRAPVRSAGVVVGRVTSITLDKQTYQGVVRMQIREGVRFPKDSSAKILTSGLLGDQYIGLEPGADDANFAAGATSCRIRAPFARSGAIRSPSLQIACSPTLRQQRTRTRYSANSGYPPLFDLREVSVAPALYS